MLQTSEPSQIPEEFSLPKFVEKRPDGLYVDLAKLDASSHFETFVIKVFAAQLYFTGLVYERFSQLIYDYTPDKIAAEIKSRKGSTFIRFAAGIREFAPERLALYHAPKIEQDMAEYFFEPVMIEAPGMLVAEKATLSFDEFVAAMWMNGIRYGIDFDNVKKIIDSGEITRCLFARPLAPMFGQDSGVKEISNALYRDDAPKELANGKIDMRQFKNRFPQIKKGARLLMKTPRTLGAVGRTISGETIEPPLPQDFDFGELVGPGTMIESTRDGDFITSALDGFLNIDLKTNQISVTEKIINRSGVNVRTTGDLSITANEFEEHGEIQEKRVLEGKNISVHANVYGKVVSHGGVIHLLEGLIGGTATNEDGDISVDGLVSRAFVHAVNGSVHLKSAENSIIIGRDITIESAVNCDIVGEAIEVVDAQGCMIAGRKIRVTQANPRKDQETVLLLLIPDLAIFDQEISEIEKKKTEFDPALAQKKLQMEAIAGKKEVASYRSVSSKLAKKEIVLTDEQKVQWQKMSAAVAPALKVLVKLSGELKALQAGRDDLDAKIAELREAKEQATMGISCDIELLHGGTMARTMNSSMTLLAPLPTKELKARLRDPRLHGERLNPKNTSNFHWKYRD